MESSPVLLQPVPDNFPHSVVVETLLHELTKNVDNFVSVSREKAHKIRRDLSLAEAEHAAKKERAKQIKKNLTINYEYKKEQQEKLERYELFQLEAALPLLEEQAQSLEKDLMSLSVAETRVKQKLHECENKRMLHELRRRLQLRNITYYEQYLGVRIEPTLKTDTMRIIFIHIEEKLPDKEFSLSLCFSPDTKTSSVSDTFPQINTAEALRRLNITNDLTRFCCDVRKLFQKTLV